MTDPEEFYQQTFLTPFIKDRCIHCHKHDVVQLIVQMEIDCQAEQGPFIHQNQCCKKIICKGSPK